MPTEISGLLDIAAPAAAGLVNAVRDDQLDAPTPCAEFRVRDLLNHLFQVTANFQLLATGAPADWASTPDALTGDWRAEFTERAWDVTAAWSEPAALEGVSAGMGLPQRTVGLMLVTDLVVHGWDLAQATGLPFRADPALLAAVAEFLDLMGDAGRAMGAFGAAVTAPPGSDDLTVQLARTGRDVTAWG
ncbi:MULTISPECIES: TIGR03086 family metal-binding protein [Actinoplanes]|uniref:TIGR03086 family metal-binding protein n=1 Tax=Actinoplanes TaxID=1865 RepID=UPI0005F2E4FF|nr:MULTISPECIES: TIGR03086 family metal-binding protein [Actinoplanes]GLY02940.1 hypothetical protein Acsp01_33190 [Actinoplanes sp. NBRC 101535]